MASLLSIPPRTSDRPADRPVPGSLTLRLAVLAVSLVIGFATLETLVRARQWLRYGSTGTQLYASMVDPASGLTIATPGQRTRRIQINSLGFRGPEIDMPKPPGRVRLAFLGASTTFCAEVTDNRTAWPHIVSETMQRQWPETSFDYVNGAFPGYVIETNRKNLQYRVRPTAPDIIVLYEAVNDLSRDLRVLAERQGIIRGNVDDNHFIGRWSLAWSLIEKNLRLMLRQHRAADEAQHVRFDDAELSRGFRSRLEQLVTEARHVAPVVAIATFSQKVRSGQSAEERLANANTHLYYMPFLSTDDMVRAFAEYNRVIREVAIAQGIVLIDGEDTIPADNRHFADSVHFTDAGSQAMAHRVSAALVQSAPVKDLVLAHSQSVGRQTH